MVLVDSSIWIRAVAGHEPFRSESAKLLRSDRAAAHELVYGEILIGDIGGRKEFLREYEILDWARPVPHRDVVALVRRAKLHGRGVGWIDVHLLASALAARMQFWTADPRLAAMADELGVAYKVSSA